MLDLCVTRLVGYLIKGRVYGGGLVFHRGGLFCGWFGAAIQAVSTIVKPPHFYSRRLPWLPRDIFSLDELPFKGYPTPSNQGVRARGGGMGIFGLPGILPDKLKRRLFRRAG